MKHTESMSNLLSHFSGTQNDQKCGSPCFDPMIRLSIQCFSATEQISIARLPPKGWAGVTQPKVFEVEYQNVHLNSTGALMVIECHWSTFIYFPCLENGWLYHCTIYFPYVPMRAISFFGATVCSLPLESSHVAPLKRAEACPKSFHVACGWLKRGYCD